jgi:hypothetical protein
MRMKRFMITRFFAYCYCIPVENPWSLISKWMLSMGTRIEPIRLAGRMGVRGKTGSLLVMTSIHQ